MPGPGGYPLGSSWTGPGRFPCRASPDLLNGITVSICVIGAVIARRIGRRTTIAWWRSAAVGHREPAVPDSGGDGGARGIQRVASDSAGVPRRVSRAASDAAIPPLSRLEQIRPGVGIPSPAADRAHPEALGEFSHAGDRTGARSAGIIHRGFAKFWENRQGRRSLPGSVRHREAGGMMGDG